MACRLNRFGITLLCVALSAAFARGADDERGLPPITTYSARQYESHYQVWASALAPDGRVFFGSYGAVLHYDGQNWRRYPVPTAFVRALAMGEDGNLYVSSDALFGRLCPDAFDNWVFESLVSDLPGPFQPLTRARTLAVHDGAVFVGSHEGVLRWTPEGVTTQEFSNGGGNELFSAGDVLCNLRQGEGVWGWHGDQWQPWANSALARTKGLLAIAAGPRPGTALLAASGAGLAVIEEDGSTREWAEAAWPAMAEATFYDATRLADGRYALASVDRGVFLLTADGESVTNLNEDLGVSNKTTLFVTEDREGGLWVSTFNGITRIQLSGGFTLFDERTGYPAGINFSLIRHQGVFYASCDGSLLRLLPARDGQTARFEPDPRVPGELRVHGLLSRPRGLLVAGSAGLYWLPDDGEWTRIAVADELISLCRPSRSDPDRIFYNREFTPGSARWDGTSWIDEGTIPGVAGETFSFSEDHAGQFWYATVTGEVFLVTRASPGQTWQEATVRRLGPEHGLPADGNPIFVYEVDGHMMFGTQSGVLEWDDAEQRFHPTRRLRWAEHSRFLVDEMTPGAGDTYWGTIGFDRINPAIGLVRWTRDGDQWQATPFSSVIDHALGVGGAQFLLSESDAQTGEILWVKGIDSLLRIEVPPTSDTGGSAAPIITRVTAGEIDRPTVSSRDTPFFPSSTAAVTFRFVAPHFDSGSTPLYRTRLLGYRDTWTAPAADGLASYTNLSGGPFTFQVQVVHPTHGPGPITAYTFSVAMPWLKRPAVQTGLIILVIGGIAGAARWRVFHLQRKQRELEQIVSARTTELAVAKDAAESANRAKSAFLANMSHELRTPLNGVLGYAQIMLRDRALPAANREQARVIASSGEHLLRMINEVLDFSKIEAGKTELRPAPFRLPDLLRDIEAAIAPRAAAKGLTFRILHEAGLPTHCLGDAQKLRQVIDNLLSNAIKFTSSGCVTFEITRIDTKDTLHVGFAVADTGVGLSAADQLHLFTPFHQAVDGRPPEPGTGLGLSISRRLVQLMGGEISVTSAPGQGSRFSFQLPLEEIALSAATSPPVDRAAIVGYAGPRRHVLVVDDVEVNRHLLRDLLRPLGFEVDCVAEADAALAALDGRAVDVVVVDLRMPGIDGLELARRIRARAGEQPQPRIILTSASVLSFDPQTAFDAGCDDFLPKPFREADLLQRLGRVLRLNWNYATIRPDSIPPFDASRPSPHLAELQFAADRGNIRGVRQALVAIRQAGALPEADLRELEEAAAGFQMDRLRAKLNMMRPATDKG